MVNRKSRSSEKGFILMVVLWVLAILSVLSLGFARRAMIERSTAWYALDHEQAIQLARGAAERAIVELSNMRSVNSFSGVGGAYTGLNQRWAQPVDLLKESDLFNIGSDPNSENDICGYRIWDCESRVSVNLASEEMLRRVKGLSGQAVRKIMSRRAPRTDRSEVSTFSALEEIRYFSGIDDEDWFGDEPGTGLRDRLSSFGSRLGETCAINVNTASPEVLRAIPDMSESIVSAILEFRAGADGMLDTGDDQAIVSITRLGDALSISAEKLSVLTRSCVTVSRFFTIEAVATRRQGKIQARVTAVVQVNAGRAQVLFWKEDPIDS